MPVVAEPPNAARPRGFYGARLGAPALPCAPPVPASPSRAGAGACGPTSVLPGSPRCPETDGLQSEHLRQIN